ncbi:hypothetical protein EMGBS15_15160 [Filimonas sp.]|nr:hypothetical protein EMGBS15_15160 [Filimonas sp.]
MDLPVPEHDLLNKSYKNYPESFDSPWLMKFAISGNILSPILPRTVCLSEKCYYRDTDLAPVVKQIVETYGQSIHGIVHNTGGGQTKCMKYIGGKVRLIKDNLFTRR